MSTNPWILPSLAHPAHRHAPGGEHLGVRLPFVAQGVDVLLGDYSTISERIVLSISRPKLGGNASRVATRAKDSWPALDARTSALCT